MGDSKFSGWGATRPMGMIMHSLTDWNSRKGYGISPPRMRKNGCSWRIHSNFSQIRSVGVPESIYVKTGDEIWLYLRRYADGEIKYSVCNAPANLPVSELDRAATLRWPIEQCFEEWKSNLWMGDYECRSYRGWVCHMLFVMISHLFATQIRESFKKSNSIDYANGNKTHAWRSCICHNWHEKHCNLSYTQKPPCISVSPKN